MHAGIAIPPAAPTYYNYIEASADGVRGVYHEMSLAADVDLSYD